MQQQLRSWTLPGCEQVKTVSACFGLWLARNPSTISTDVVGYAAQAVTAGMIDRTSKDATAPESALWMADNMLAVLENTEPKNFLIIKKESSGMTDGAAKMLFKKQEGDNLKTAQEKISKSVRKILTQFEEKALAAAPDTEKARFASIRTRVEALEKRDFSF